MQNSERGQFEEEWRRTFEGSEAVPSDKVWLSVESSLANAQNDINKKRVVYYQRLAAALLLLLVSSVLVTYWQWDSGSPERSVATLRTEEPSNDKKDDQNVQNKKTAEGIADLSDESPDAGKVKPDPGLDYVSGDNNSREVSESNVKAKRKRSSEGSVKTYSDKQSKSTGKAPLYALDMNDKKTKPEEVTIGGISGEETSPVISLQSETSIQTSDANLKPEESKPLTEEEEKALVKKMLADAGIVTEENKEEDKAMIRKPAWVSFGASGGSFSGSSPSAAAASFSSYSMQDASSFTSYYSKSVSNNAPSTTTGIAYSVGLNAGKPIGKKWIAQVGIAYLNRRSTYESVIVEQSNSGPSAFLAQSVKADASGVYSFTAPYNVENISEFVSIPVQMGYLIVDKKFGWVVNTGVAADLFLRNTVIDKSGNFGDVSQTGSDQTTFRPVSWSGLANTEFTYKLTDHYKFALVPGIRYSITNIVKDDSGSSHPLTFDVGFRFRYTF